MMVPTTYIAPQTTSPTTVYLAMRLDRWQGGGAAVTKQEVAVRVTHFNAIPAPVWRTTMSNAKMSDRNDAMARDQADMPDSNEGELSQDELNNVAGGLRASRRNDQAADPSDLAARGLSRYTDKSDAAMARNDDKNDPNDLAR
jgi:hypothetical protein